TLIVKLTDNVESISGGTGRPPWPKYSLIDIVVRTLSPTEHNRNSCVNPSSRSTWLESAIWAGDGMPCVKVSRQMESLLPFISQSKAARWPGRGRSPSAASITVYFRPLGVSFFSVELQAISRVGEPRQAEADLFIVVWF